MFEIGNTLREARTRQNLDFMELEQATKIRGKYLRALEDERFEILPSQTYVKGFLRSYADYLGLDGQIYVDEWNSRFATGEEEAPLRPRRSTARPRHSRKVERNVVVLALLGIGVVTALIFAAWKFGGGNQPHVPNLGRKPGPAKPVVRGTKQANLLVKAVRGDSLVVVRLGSATGRQVYNGTIQQKGQSQHFVARRLWLDIGSPANLEFHLNGRKLQIGGNKPCVLVVTSKIVRPAAPGTC